MAGTEDQDDALLAEYVWRLLAVKNWYISEMLKLRDTGTREENPDTPRKVRLIGGVNLADVLCPFGFGLIPTFNQGKLAFLTILQEFNGMGDPYAACIAEYCGKVGYPVRDETEFYTEVLGLSESGEQVHPDYVGAGAWAKRFRKSVTYLDDRKAVGDHSISFESEQPS